MLGVLKRRWKPKRASNNNNNNNNNNSGRHAKSGTDISSCEISIEKHRVATSPRQIHPACEDKTHVVAYDEDINHTDTPSGIVNSYPLAPNICVEAGRIEFIKPPLENAVVNAEYSNTLPDVTTPPSEKVDVAKECLEAKVRELEAALEAEKKAAQRERLAAAKFQRQLARREVLQRDVDRERRLRLDSECRLRNSVSDAERCRARLAALQREFTRMEETVRAMLHYKNRYEQLKQDKISLSAAYEIRVHKFQSALSKLSQENETLKKQVHMLEAAGAGEVQAALVERLRVLELNNCTLSREGEVQRKQYERCLDDVANQVVRALLAQKSLREEISNLQQRVKDLETQNKALTTLLLQQLHQNSNKLSNLINQQCTVEPVKSSSSVKFALPAPGRPSSCDDARLRVWEESVVWLPLQRPNSLNLEACCRAIPIGEGGRKSSGEEDEGSESPESGNRDEGYSTMSSDVQGLSVAPRRGLEDVKEASDETENAPLSIDCNNAPERLPEPEVVLIPLSLALSVNSGSRHSYPPLKELLPYQHIMRSFSDSHLCIKLAAAPNGSNYSLASTESVLVLERPPVPLCRSRAVGSNIKAMVVQEEDDDTNSWCSGDWWDADYVQHWLRLDETRSALQQQMEYDAAELEDWSMDENEIWRKCDLPTPSQVLPSIRESGTSELEEDSNECLWNSSSYLVDQVITADGNDSCHSLWPYGNHSLISPGGDSWSSVGTNSEDGRSYNDGCQNGSKRSSTAMSTDSGEIPVVGTDFTRDFYRLVKFESTKSLASTSSRSQTGESVGIRRGDLPVSVPLSSDREHALQSVLHFIAEQQQYCLSREVADGQSNETFVEEAIRDVKGVTKDHSCEAATENLKESPLNENEIKNASSKKRLDSCEPFPVEPNCNEKSCCKNLIDDNKNETVKNGDSKLLRFNSSGDFNDKQCQETEVLHIDNSSSNFNCEKAQINMETCKIFECKTEQTDQSLLLARPGRADISRSGLRPVPEEDEEHPSISDSLTSTTSSVTTVCNPYPLISSENKNESLTSLQESSDMVLTQQHQESLVIAESRSISFHERATTKDVIDELNRMIRKGEDGSEAEGSTVANNLDVACCCPTGWVHVDREIDFTDPKARANLLDVMLAASHSSSSTGSSSSNSDSGDEPADYQHLHRLHRFRRQKKASASREPLGALRCPSAAPRPSIIGRNDFYVRYGEKEMEAVASFDFLEDMSTTSVSGASSCENANPVVITTNAGANTSSTDDSEQPAGEQLSLSDSCGASFSGSDPSLNVQ